MSDIQIISFHVFPALTTNTSAVATVLPYLQVSKHALPAQRSVLISPPTNALYGIWSAFRQRNLFFGLLALATLLAELSLPVTLSNVPFSRLETWQTQIVCAWLSIATLGFMLLVVAASFLVRWPHMPVDPRTVAGAMYYVCDSWMLESMEGMATSTKAERDARMRHLKQNYMYGNREGVSGKSRLGVDVVDDRGEAAVSNQKPQYS